VSKYTPPSGRNVIFDFDDEGYTAPDGRAVIFNFGEEQAVARYVSVEGEAHSGYGTASIYLAVRSIYIDPFVATRFGEHKAVRQQFIKPGGFDASAYGLPTIWNFNKNIQVSGFDTLAVSRHRIYNLKQFVNQLYYGFNSAVFGQAKMLGGVRYISNAKVTELSEFGPVQVVNTRANRTLRPLQIDPPVLPQPIVSPRMIYPSGIRAWSFGNPWVQRNPSPKGFVSDQHGTAWVSHSPRYITPGRVEAFLPGYGRVFDPTQKIYLAGSPPIAAGVFGDIRVQTNLNKITVKGEDHAQYGDWSLLYSNLTNLNVQSFDASFFGSHNIWNKTPSLIPAPFDAAAFGNSMISDRVRRILGRGFATADVQRFGNARFTKSPELNVPGSNQLAFGNTWISNKTRNIETGNLHTLAIGSHRIWFRYRYIEVSGIAKSDQGNPKIEHSLRTIFGKGSSSDAYGQSTVWYRVRKISPASIYKEFESNHRVGGTQHIQPGGFVASQFGERIVPENQGIYALGFNAAEFSELNRIEHHTRWVRATGFHSFGQQTSDRYGTARIWNLRQYVRHEYDSGDGLNPGEFGQWTAIANRNRNIGVLGYTATRYGYNVIENKATPLLVQGFNGSVFSKPMTADRIRYLKPESMEAPYISGWGRIVNTAHVIKPVSGVHTTWGHPTVLNTRREYRWVGAFDSLQIGHPMIDFAIRTITVPSRYSIGPVSMPLPTVYLHTRYVDTIASEHTAFGGPSLVIKWNIITPRWTHREYLGTPAVKNLTPELRQRGVNSEVFGLPSLRLQWQSFNIEGYGAELWGKTGIAYRDRSIPITGANYMAFGQHRVIKTGAPPYSLQNITLDFAGEGTRPDTFEGQGIRPPENQVGRPSLRTNVIGPSGFVATQYSVHQAQSNNIVVEPGIQELTIGEHTVVLRNKTISVPSLGDMLQMKETRPRISPHTIYAVMEAPQQAKENHTARSLHYVDDHGGGLPPGSIIGNHTISLKHRRVETWGSNFLSVPRPSVILRRQYVLPNGIQSFRMGWHSTLDGSTSTLEQFESADTSRFGGHKIESIYRGPRYLRPQGFIATQSNRSLVEFFHREIQGQGFAASRMGASRDGDTPYKPQSLWVGHPAPTKPRGFNAEIFGKTTIGLRVREVVASGFDAFVSEWDGFNFKGRLKVEQVKKPVVIEPKHIQSQSFGQTAYGVPDIRLKVHYIRPDGNSDQYRKGAPE
jgi:hypothetical protein